MGKTLHEGAFKYLAIQWLIVNSASHSRSAGQLRRKMVTTKRENMKLFSLILLVACVALVGCQKPADDASTAPSTNAPATK